MNFVMFSSIFAISLVGLSPSLIKAGLLWCVLFCLLLFCVSVFACLCVVDLLYCFICF
uniref:Uncharacterized protein n=1 Tax=Octopus bimaculoides TaxID=37653 RepID=A0A0L8HG10_OCTBM